MINNKCPLISVIIPFYNSRLDFFHQAIESVLAQSYTNWEAIVINDGSNSQNKNELEKYINSLRDKRISLTHHEKNFGPAVARNKGIELSKGEILTFLDSDDSYLPWFFEQVISNFNENPNCLILSSHYIFHIDFLKIKRFCIPISLFSFMKGEKSKDEILQTIKSGRGCLFPQLSIKKEVFKEVKYDPEFLRGEDTDLIFQILNNKELLNKTTICPILGYIYRIYPSKTRLTHRKELMFKNVEKLIAKYKDKNSITYKLIRTWIKDDDWKYNNLLYKYLNHGSLFGYLYHSFLNFHTFKDKVKSIRALLFLGIVHKYLTPAFGIDFQDINTLFDWKNDKYKMLKNMYKEYLINQKASSGQNYANNFYERLFK